MMVEILCPSRGRPEQVKRMIDSALDNAFGFVGVAIGIDDDDPKKDEYLNIIHPDINIQIFQRNGEAGDVSVVNGLARNAKGYYVLFVGDDVIFRTKHWDKMMTSRMPMDDIGIVTPNNGSDKTKACLHFMVTKKWCDIVGWVLPPQITHYYSDPVLQHIGEKLGRLIKADDVVIDHLHWERTKQTVRDETHARVEANTSKDRATYTALIKSEHLKQKIEELRRAMRV